MRADWLISATESRKPKTEWGAGHLCRMMLTRQKQRYLVELVALYREMCVN